MRAIHTPLHVSQYLGMFSSQETSHFMPKIYKCQADDEQGCVR